MWKLDQKIHIENGLTPVPLFQKLFWVRCLNKEMLSFDSLPCIAKGVKEDLIP